MSDITFQEKSLLSGWCIEVRKGPFHIGNIRRNPSSGAFQYYNGRDNQLNYKFEEVKLEHLKEKVIYELK